MEERLKENIRKIVYDRITTLRHEDKFLPEFIKFFQERFGDSLIAVIFYGSRLFDPVKNDGLYDFYVIVDFYEKVHSSIWHILLNRILPPSVYMAEVSVDDQRVGAKYNIISFQDFIKYIVDPPEIYIVGRFSKAVYIAYARDEDIKWKISDLIRKAMYFCLVYTIPMLDDLEKFDLERLIFEILSLSYKGEVRIEDPNKLSNLLEADKDFYFNVYVPMFLDYVKQNEGIIFEIDRSEDVFKKTWAVVGDPIPSKQEVINFLKVSARRGVLRWPKGLITFRGYREYLERKVKKSGEDVELSEIDKRYPLIFGWRHVIKLLREGKLKSGIQREIETKQIRQKGEI
ncbi:MAG: hypothetical protein N2254_02990 [bacterium]|nr:hypothetical protein [bacterium]